MFIQIVESTTQNEPSVIYVLHVVMTSLYRFISYHKGSTHVVVAPMGEVDGSVQEIHLPDFCFTVDLKLLQNIFKYNKVNVFP